MLSKSQISFIKSLQQKKFRKEHNLFIVEGLKSITEFLASKYQVQTIYCLSKDIPNLPKLSQKQKVFEITEQELTKISSLQNPQEALALIEIPQLDVNVLEIEKEINLVLDGVQDPGNLGTIIRTADWFGFSNIICSKNTVDVYNPKVVQATMGSLARVNVSYVDLPAYLIAQQLPKFGTLLDGKNIYHQDWPEAGFLILGSEGNGISDEIISLLDGSVTIPKLGQTESLNVGIAAAICCSEIKRKSLK
ncbi:tRNA/rRNA methyltransferase (SpoU) [Pseudopedobacter saltans DSM 12145]|uniref:tRNA/rRNA methyltransferase (SpoU) n=1 Tax=Pseudopedobacter saltans (strain ATCC 51119 / DSM 12145 / JCM 21818 / CCUG 39354 / LMG 10337 / NBRC 100064 / NCIMB 13643) TaxID=762903 RepID=F0SEN9_PSESL|nr:RNA methyltransferase [Pseudopedobacter saltans]ADY51929.1 tRNA/rRNA methyltransferase (SpoU) [Pseudopedobacter saltans DSM 12145]